MAELPPCIKAEAIGVQSVLARLKVNPEIGLRHADVVKRRLTFGANTLRQASLRTPVAIFIDQLRSIVVYILIAAAAVSLALAEWTDGAAILVVLVINTAIGFLAELKAVRSMDALRRLGLVRAHVLRDNRVHEVPASNLVPGDIVLLSAGSLVPADMRLIEVSNFGVDESMLTGESVPVSKQVEPVSASRPLAERRSMAYRGCAVTRGSAKGVVVATGMRTELGRIAELAATAAPEVTPLEKRLDRLGGQLVWATLGLILVILMVGVVTGHGLLAMTKTAVALGVAAVPEGLPIVATVALARGMWRILGPACWRPHRFSRSRQIYRSIPGVVTLGTIAATRPEPKASGLCNNTIWLPDRRHDEQPAR